MAFRTRAFSVLDVDALLSAALVQCNNF